MTATQTCSSCGGEIQEDVSFQQCPRCLLGLGLLRDADAATDGDTWDSTPLADWKAGFGDYQIIERIGGGGMGIVYRARQISLDRIVALKTIRAGELASTAALARFRREAETVAKLDHPSIVPIYAVGEHEANPFLVMRLVEGTSLAEKLRDAREQFHPQTEIARLMSCVGRAVHYAHERGVLHRDLKPSNILLDNDGNPHLTDFGIAKLADQETALTQTAELLGTPAYMSPEQATGKAAGPAADIYSLGALLYELLTGRPPFQGARPMEVLRQVLEQEPAHPRLVNPAADHDLATICLKCLEKNPARRYASALEFAEDIERWQRHEPIRARPAGPMLRLQRWTIRNPALATLIAGLVVGMSVTLVLLAKTREEKARKSIALAILRTESARQLQEIWDSPRPFFAIRSETLAAMSGKDPAKLHEGETRFTLAFVAQGNPLDRLLGAAPLLEHVEQRMSGPAQTPTRIDLRLYKRQAEAVEDLIGGSVDFVQMNAREYLRAKSQHPDLEPLVRGIPAGASAVGREESAVVFTREGTGIKALGDLRGKSFLFGTEDSTLSFWAKVHLAEAGITARDLANRRYLDVNAAISADNTSSAAPALGNPYSDMTPVEAVVGGMYDAAVVREARFVQVATGQKLVALKRFDDSGYVLAGQGDLPGAALAGFRQAMTNLTEPQMLQTFMGFPRRFEPCADSDFDEMRTKLAAEALFDRAK